MRRLADINNGAEAFVETLNSLGISLILRPLQELATPMARRFQTPPTFPQPCRMQLIRCRAARQLWSTS